MPAGGLWGENKGRTKGRRAAATKADILPAMKYLLDLFLVPVGLQYFGHKHTHYSSSRAAGKGGWGVVPTGRPKGHTGRRAPQRIYEEIDALVA